MNAAHKELEVELHGVFAQGEFDRLGCFEYRCASQVAARSMPASWRAAPDLAGERLRRASADFNTRAEALKIELPTATTASRGNETGNVSHSSVPELVNENISESNGAWSIVSGAIWNAMQGPRVVPLDHGRLPPNSGQIASGP